jgi:cysteine desulfurase
MPYLDHAATTPMLAEVIDAVTASMRASGTGVVGNPSSVHTSGRRARRVIEESRERLAAALDARPSEVIFTSGGTEADNLAVKGIYLARRAADPARRRLLVSSVEHHAVLDSADWLVEHEGAELVLLPVDSDGVVRPEALAAAIADDPAAVALVSVMWANNEVGSIQPISELAEIAHAAGSSFHTDAVQAVGTLGVSFAASGADAMTVTAHKIGGPYGVGALLLGRGVPCLPVLHGGGQERDVRSGTLDTPGAVGFSLAAELAVSRRTALASRLTGLRNQLIAGVLDAVPDAVLNGHPTHRLPGNAHLSFPGCEGDSLLMLLDARGIECSTGSACSAGVAQPSHVLLAMGADEPRARGALRLSLGHNSTEQDVRTVVEAIGPVVERARRAGAAAGLASASGRGA